METPVKGFVFCITKPHILKLGQGKNKHMHHHQAAVGTCLLVSAVYWPSTSTDKTEHEDHPTSFSMGSGGGGGLSPQISWGIKLPNHLQLLLLSSILILTYHICTSPKWPQPSDTLMKKSDDDSAIHITQQTP
jgi:hypothetical protein